MTITSKRVGKSTAHLRHRGQKKQDGEYNASPLKMQSECTDFNQKRLVKTVHSHIVVNRNYQYFISLGVSPKKNFQESYPHDRTLINHSEITFNCMYFIGFEHSSKCLSAGCSDNYPQL